MDEDPASPVATVVPEAASSTAGDGDQIQSYLANPVISATTVVTKNEDQIYKCPLCQDDLHSQKDFTSHIRAHNEVKPCPDPNDPTGQAKVYYCCLCGKMLSSFSSLDRHMLVHSGERPFSCELCGQTFTTNGNMHRHKRTHSAKELAEFNEANGGISKASGRRGGRKRKSAAPNTPDGKSKKAGGGASAKEETFGEPVEAVNGGAKPESGEDGVQPAAPPALPFPDFSGMMSKLFSNSKPLPYLPTTPVTSGVAALAAASAAASSAAAAPSSLPPPTNVTTIFPNSPNLLQPQFSLLAKAIQAEDAASSSGKPLSAFTTAAATTPASVASLAASSLLPPCGVTTTTPATSAAAATATGLHDLTPNSALKQQSGASSILLNVNNNNTKKDLNNGVDPGDDGQKDLADVQSIISVTRASGLSTAGSETADDNKSEGDEGEDEAGLPLGSQDDNDPLIKDMKLKGEFPCRLCPAVYPNLRALKGHNKEHLVKAPYSCNVGKCEYSSNDKSTLSRHMRTHTGEKPFECKLCNYGFTTKANCERHLKNKHGKTGRDTIRENLIIHETDEPEPSTLQKMQLEAQRPEGSGDYRCKVCKQHFETSEKVISHAVVDHPAYQNDVDHIFEIMKGSKSKEARASAAAAAVAASLSASDLSGAPSMVPRVTPYPPLSQLRPVLPSQNKTRNPPPAATAISPLLKPIDVAAITKNDGTASDGDADDAPLDLSFPSKSNSGSPQPPQLAPPPGPQLGAPLAGVPFGLPSIPLPQATNSANLSAAAAAALSAANLDPALREEVYKNAAAVAMAMPLVLPAAAAAGAGGPGSLQPRLAAAAVNPQAVAAAAAAITAGGLSAALPFPNLLPPAAAAASTNGAGGINIDSLEAEIKRRMQQQQAQAQAQAAALAAVGLLKARQPRPPQPQQQPQPAPIAPPPLPPPPPPPLQAPQQPFPAGGPSGVAAAAAALAASNDVTAFISAQREILRKQPVAGAGGGASLFVSPPPASAAATAGKEVGGASSTSPLGEIKEDKEGEEAAAAVTPPPQPAAPATHPPPPPLLRKPERANGEQEAIGGGDQDANGSALSYSDDESNYKMIIKNGVLMKKQKQRRYRTERPYGCEHCSARFTLRSNMERHIKQQHPEHWTSKPRGGRRNNSVTVPVIAPHLSSAPTPQQLLPHTRGAMAMALPTAPLPVEAIHEDLTSENGGTEVGIVDDDSEAGGEDSGRQSAADDGLVAKEKGDEPNGDLASVSNMINTASNNAFKEFLDRKAGDEPDVIDLSNDDDGPAASDQPLKKTPLSAYSAAPHKIPCPHCNRRFPWMSSLNRHLLTHSGSKPYKCSACPLWFTTKSNCERHQVRKHGNAKAGDDGDGGEDNAPERPFKCNICPSTSFSTTGNLRKHRVAKHSDVEFDDEDEDEGVEASAAGDDTYEEEERENEDEERTLVQMENGSLADEEDLGEEIVSLKKNGELPAAAPAPPTATAPPKSRKRPSLMDTIAKLSGSAAKKKKQVTT